MRNRDFIEATPRQVVEWLKEELGKCLGHLDNSKARLKRQLNELAVERNYASGCVARIAWIEDQILVSKVLDDLAIEENCQPK